MRRWAVAAAVLLPLLAVGAWLHLARRGHSATPRRNVLLVSIDTLRADHVGCYGYATAATPTLDALAARGLRFEQATTVAPLTLPAHSSLMTGTFPAHHGVRDNGGFYLREDETTLAEVLKANGYSTGGFVSAFVLDSRFGIHQGFARYFDDFDLDKHAGQGMDAVQRRGDETVAKALEWLSADRDKPFFAWIHLYDPHAPYDAPEPYRSRFPASPIGAYDAEIAWTDSLVARILAGLQDRLAQTLVVVVGDHGESFGEHQERGHGFFVYDATLQVPLIVAGPGVPARAIPEQVRIVDVMPTVLDWLGLAVPPAVQGKSLLPLARGESLPLIALSESWHPRFHYGWSELVAVRDGRFKLIQAPHRELYDLQHDAGEGQNLAVTETPRADAMERALHAMLDSVTTAGGPRAPEPLDAETRERLQALGYVGGSISAERLEERSRPDPKDRIGLYNLLKQAGFDSSEGRVDDAIARAREALAADPEIQEAYVLLGNFQTKAGRHREAVEAYKKAAALDPDNAATAFDLALAEKSLDRLDEAEAGFERVLVLDPHDTRSLWQLADVAMQHGRFDQAETLLKEGLKRKGDRVAFLLKLGECYVEMARLPEAEAAFEEVRKAKPELRTLHYDLALLKEARGDVPGAIAEYEADLRAEPNAYRASFNLGKLLLKARRPQDAARRFRDALAAKPDFGAGHLYLAKALLDAGDLRGARDEAKQGLESDPGTKLEPLGHYILADVYNRMGRGAESAREVAAAHKLERKS